MYTVSLFSNKSIVLDVHFTSLRLPTFPNCLQFRSFISLLIWHNRQAEMIVQTEYGVDRWLQFAKYLGGPLLHDLKNASFRLASNMLFFTSGCILQSALRAV